MYFADILLTRFDFLNAFSLICISIFIFLITKKRYNSFYCKKIKVGLGFLLVLTSIGLLFQKNTAITEKDMQRMFYSGVVSDNDLRSLVGLYKSGDYGFISYKMIYGSINNRKESDRNKRLNYDVMSLLDLGVIKDN